MNLTGWLHRFPFGVLALAAFLPSVAARAEWNGPFTLADGITFYLVDDAGSGFEATVRYRNPHRAICPTPCLVRVFDPEEQIVARHEFPVESTEAEPKWAEVRLSVPARGPGVYQLIAHDGSYDGEVDLQLSRPLRYGVFGHFQWLVGQREQLTDTHFYWPPRLAELTVELSRSQCTVTVTDPAGREALKVDPTHPKATVALPGPPPTPPQAGGTGGAVWRLAATPGTCTLDFKGAPIILCPDPDTARKIHASVEVREDGTIFYHRFQRRAQEILARYRALPPEAFAVDVPPLEQFADEWLKEPARNQLLLGPYGVLANVRPCLAEQNLDPQSPWFGSIRVWKEKADQDPVKDYGRCGVEAYAGLVKVLAAAYSLDQPFNPYHGQPGLLNRIIIGSLQNLMCLREGEYAIPDNTYYYGLHAFNFTHHFTGAFALVAPDCPEDVREVWTEGLRRYVDRMLYGQVASTTNQWTHIPMSIWHFYQGTGETFYRDAALRHVRWIATGAMHGLGQRPAGYMAESEGPDSTYNGMTGSYLAWLYHESREPLLRDSLQRAYYLFNHTICVEPDGSWLGASNFCHRTPGDWTSPQYGAGLGMMADDLPEAGLRPGRAWLYPAPPTTPEEVETARQQLQGMLKEFPADHFDAEAPNAGRASGAFDIAWPNYLFYSSQPVPGVLPCQEEGSFTRNFGDEFLCVKRPDYYTFVYAGRPMGEWQKDRLPREPDHQYPRNDGGLGLFATPPFGAAVLGKNWSTYACQTVIATTTEGEVQWPYYWSIQSTLREEPAEAVTTGRLRDLPITFERRLTFADNRVEGALTLVAEKDVTLASLVECFPIAPEKTDAISVELCDAAGQKVESGDSAQTIRFVSSVGPGPLITLDQPRPVTVRECRSVDHYGGEHAWRSVVIALPPRLTAAEPTRLRWMLLPQ